MDTQIQKQFFHSYDWFSIIHDGLGATINDNQCISQGIPIFRKGPFRIAYPGFPIGDIPSSIKKSLSCNPHQNSVSEKWELLRLWQSVLVNQCQTYQKHSGRIPETAIHDLQNWNISQLSSSIRRNIKKADRSNVRIDEANENDAPYIYKLYKEMIKTHKGKMRYSLPYFNALVKVSRNNPNLMVKIAHSTKGDIISMLVSAYHKGNAYYLHGATNPHYLNMRPADTLMFDTLQSAKQKNIRSFSFLPSPIGQDGLIRFKEKWGGTTSMTPVFDLFQSTPRSKFLGLSLKAINFLQS